MMTINPFLLLFILAIGYCCWFIYRKILWPWEKLEHIPGPPSKPFLGVATEIPKYRDWEHFMISMQEKYGPVFKLNFPFTTLICLGDVDKIRQVIQNPKSPAYEFLRPLLGQGLTVSEGNKWQHDRRLLDAGFSFKYIRNLHSLMVRYTHTLINHLDKFPADSIVNLNIELANLAFDITGGAMIGVDFKAISKEKNPLLIAYESCLNILYRRRTWVWEKYNIFQNKALAKHLKFIEDQVTQVIQKRRQEHNDSEYRRNDILDILLTKNSETGAEEFSDKDIIDQLNSFLFAGTDSTSATMSMAIYFLLKNPKALEQCLNELKFLKEKNYEPSYDDLKEMNFMQRVINETLRLSSPGSTARQFMEADLELFGMKSAPKHTDTIIYVVPSLVHHNAEYWSNPSEFDPDRFLPENSKDRDSYAFLPFMTGKRNCIGKNFAAMEMKIVLSMVLSRFNFELVPGHEVRNIDQIGNSRDKGGVKVTITKKQVSDALHA
jgi:cytochrome P450